MDQVIHALAAGENVRIAAISAYDMVSGARALHELSRVATAALGRQLMMTAMMASQLKNEGDRVSTILRGDGPAGNMVCTGAPGPVVKGYTSDPTVELPLRSTLPSASSSRRWSISAFAWMQRVAKCAPHPACWCSRCRDARMRRSMPFRRGRTRLQP